MKPGNLKMVEGGPFGPVLRLGRTGDKALAIALVGALLVHGAGAARAALISVELLRWTQRLSGQVRTELNSVVEVEIAREPDPPPQPVPEPPEPPPPAPTKADPPPKAETAKTEAKAAPPPAAAQAAAVLTQEPDPNEPVDLTNAFVTGSGSTYAGGVTQAGGTSTVAVRDTNARAGGTPRAVGTGAPQPAVDLSREASLRGGHDWSCPWPEEADSEQKDEALVTIRLSIGSDGKVASAAVVSDPGLGFAREAKSCALRQLFSPALDRQGKAVAQAKTFRIRFER